MLNAKDYTPDGKDRDEWNRLWRARTQRLLPYGCQLNLGRQGSSQGLTAVTIAENPPEFAELVFRDSDICPICGESTADCARVAASLDLTFEAGLNFGMGVWAHRECFEACSDTGEPARVPW